MVLRPWLSPVLTLALAGSMSVMLYQANRTSILSTICEAGLRNLSRPDEIPSDALNCAIVGDKETVTGVIHDSDHGSSITLKSDSRPIHLWIGRAFPLLAKQLQQSDENYCMRGATVTLTGWRTQAGGPFGELGYANEQLFVRTIDTVAPLPADEIVQAGADPTWCHRI